MLVLSRRRNERVQITVPPSDTPTVIDAVCIDIRGDKTRWGFDAPKEVTVHREEVARAIARREAAANGEEAGNG